MKLYEISQGFGIDQLALSERPQPRPGPGQVLVQVQAASLNYRDLRMVEGFYTYHPLPNLVPLSDGAGEVVETGEGVTRFKPGDRVVASFMQTWIEGEPNEFKAKSALGGGMHGMLAEYVVLDQNGLLPVPDHLSIQEAATLPCAAVTAWNALMVTARIKPGDSVLLLGTGGVSIFALQFAKLAGARIVATSSHEDKLERLRHMGAHVTLNYKTTPKWGDEIRKQLGGVDCVVEVGGAGTLGESLRAVRTGGTIALIGVLSGTGEMNPAPVFMRAVRLQGIYVGSRVMFEDMNRAIALHRLKPVIDRVFPFDQARDALRYMKSGAHFGKIVIQVA